MITIENFEKGVELYFKNASQEIFFPETYEKEYTLRGQITHIRDEFRNGKGHVNIIYNLTLFGLINKKYIRNLLRGKRHVPFGVFVGRTNEEFLGYIRKDLLRFAEEVANKEEEKEKVINTMLNWRSPGIKKDINDFEGLGDLLEMPYISDLKEIGKNSILVKAELDFDRIVVIKEPNSIPYYEKREYGLLVRHFSKGIRTIRRTTIYREYFENLYDIILKVNFEYDGMSRGEFFRLLNEIADISDGWISIVRAMPERIIDNDGMLNLAKTMRQRIPGDYRDSITNFMDKYNYVRMEGIQEDTIEKRKKITREPIFRFCFDFFDSLVDDLLKYKAIKLCKSCNRIITEEGRIKYCNDECKVRYHQRKHYLKEKQLRKSDKSKTHSV